jgi:4-diphosphocytidyl-2-C-methyl-D-erythritol kinase
LPVPLVENAPAKVNLTLRVLDRRADGYHEISSLVVFADVADRLTLIPGGELTLAVGGPRAASAGNTADNLVLKAARALAAGLPGIVAGAFDLEKNLPAAAGIGGGSADAAAALRLLARANKLAAGDPRLYDAARATGADVPVCLDPRPRLMRGIGETLSPPLKLPPLFAILTNPGVAVPTKDVFANWTKNADAPLPLDVAAVEGTRDARFFIDVLARDANDLEAAAIKLAPVIAEAIEALRALDGCRLARMSGSGASCFGVFDSLDAAQAAAARLKVKYPRWWVQACRLGDPVEGAIR